MPAISAGNEAGLSTRRVNDAAAGKLPAAV
jgi:hypothetical protein